jgi:peptidoglycan hydrolase CwlO-like protein
MSWIKNILNKDTAELEQRVKDLTLQLNECNNKLVEKQEHINTTNAYWKKKMHELKSKKKPTTDL